MDVDNSGRSCAGCACALYNELAKNKGLEPITVCPFEKFFFKAGGQYPHRLKESKKLTSYPNGSASPSDPRGIKNNNPGNLRISDSPWRGKIPNSQNTDGEFEQFESMTLGARAMMRNIITWKDRGKDTLHELIYTLAPTSENPTEAYIKFVSSQTGIPRDKKLVLNQDSLPSIAYAMSKMENGNHNQLDLQLFKDACKLV